MFSNHWTREKCWKILILINVATITGLEGDMMLWPVEADLDAVGKNQAGRMARS